jgi:hypothetical protein
VSNHSSVLSNSRAILSKISAPISGQVMDMAWPTRLLCHVTNEIYCLGYDRGRWNGIWKFLFAGYAPHCRPIALGSYLKTRALIEHRVHKGEPCISLPSSHLLCRETSCAAYPCCLSFGSRSPSARSHAMRNDFRTRLQIYNRRLPRVFWDGD